MFIDWLANKDLEDSESLIIRVAGVVIFAVSVCVIDAVLLWNLNMLLLAGMSVIAGSIGFFVAITSPIVIKVIPPVVFFSLAGVGAKEIYGSYLFQKERAAFLAETDNCKAVGLQIVNKGSWAPVCMKEDTLANNTYCSYFKDNEWFCRGDSYYPDVIAKPGKPSVSKEVE